MAGKLRPGVRCHDEHNVPEIGLAPFVVCQSCIIHDLQQDIIDVLMRLFNLVEQEHRIRGLADGIRQQSAILVTYISRRRTDEFGNGVFLGIFAHVEAQQFDAQLTGQHTSDLRLSHTRRPDEQEGCQRFVFVQQSRS